MQEMIVRALESEGYEVDDTDGGRIVVLRTDGKPVMEIDWSGCSPAVGDFLRIGRALVAAAEMSG